MIGWRFNSRLLRLTVEFKKIFLPFKGYFVCQAFGGQQHLPFFVPMPFGAAS